jgi:hypothetical protein
VDKQGDGLFAWKPENIGQGFLWCIVGGAFLLGPPLLIFLGYAFLFGPGVKPRGWIIVGVSMVIIVSTIGCAHRSGNARAVYRKVLWGVKLSLIIVGVALALAMYAFELGIL